MDTPKTAPSSSKMIPSTNTGNPLQQRVGMESDHALGRVTPASRLSTAALRTDRPHTVVALSIAGFPDVGRRALRARLANTCSDVRSLLQVGRRLGGPPTTDLGPGVLW